MYSPSVGGGHSGNQTHDPTHTSIYAPSHSSQNNNVNDTTPTSLNPERNYNNTNSFSKSKSKPKKKFGFNIQNNSQAFYHNFPPLFNNHLQPPSAVPSSSSHSYTSFSSPSSPPSPSSPLSTHSTSNSIHGAPSSSSTRKFGNPTSSGSNFTAPNFNANGVKSKTRMFGLNYKINS